MTDKHLNAMENFEMLKALYDFQAVYPKTISFDEGEYFILHQTSARQRNWWQVVSMKGNIGFVPSNYVTKLKVEPEFIIGFLDSSIESLRLSKEDDLNGIIKREELIEKLEERKEEVKELIALKESPEKDDQPPQQNDEKIGNGRLKNSETVDYAVPTRDTAATAASTSTHVNHVPSAAAPPQKHEFTKKSMSSPAVGQQLPQLVNESPSMSVISTKLEDQPQQLPATASSKKTPNYDNSIASEPSEATTTTTTTSTSDEITTVSKIETSDRHEATTEKQEITANESGGAAADNTSTTDKIESTTKKSNGNSSNVKAPPVSVIVSEHEVYQIIDSIRQNTNLSHELSCTALRIVLSELESILPAAALIYLEPVANHLTGPLAAPENLLGQTHDAQRLRIIFSDLADCKNDTEQRSWMLYEDEDDICRFLRELINILTHADPKICCHEMSVDQYQSTMNLVLYYQMEVRWTIRKLVVDALTAMCHLDATAVNIILNSILPIELVEDMKVSIMKVGRLKELAEVLTIIFSMGQKMPVTHEENLGTDFVLFLLTIIETPPDEDTHGVLPDVMINLMLSFNLQFDDFANNIVLDALKKVSDAKNFTEKILLLINREEDPIKILNHTAPPVNSVLKMFVDLFSVKETAALFYMNDNKVLIDILVRQLSDLSPGDPMRRWYLELCRRILRNTDYADHTHRKQDLMKIFTRIFCEETECSAKDQQLVREIANEFPQIFKA